MAFDSVASSSLVTGALVVSLVAIALVLAYAFRLRHLLLARMRSAEAETELRRSTEAELALVRGDLEERVRQRTHALERRNEELMRLRLALETANRRLQRLVAVDALTGIANRRHFDRALERELRRVRRERQPLSLIFLDLDEFKRFNDTYGHARGDEVLRRVAQTLDETFRRGGDFVARYGGEEFAVVLPGVDGRRASLYAERLRRRIWRLSIPYGASQTNDRVTISGGVATITAGQIATPDQVLLVADRALYRAKCLGKNRIVTQSVDQDSQNDSNVIGMAS